MNPTYNEGELILRLLVGVVFPVLILVVLRLTRIALGRWENRWRPGAVSWFKGIYKKGNLTKTDKKAENTVSFLVALGRILIVVLLVILLSVAWFALFPQTRPLAGEFANGLLQPLLDFAGQFFRLLLTLLYAALLFFGAFFGNRYLSRNIREKHPDSPFALPLYSTLMQICIWLFAIFLCLLPYPGLPRIFAIGILLLTLLVAVLATRPLTEEMAIGTSLKASLGLTRGTRLRLEGEDCRVVDLKPLQIALEMEDHKGGQVLIPYSRLLKARISDIEPGAPTAGQRCADSCASTGAVGAASAAGRGTGEKEGRNHAEP